jgi:hypothetical protein
LLDTEEQQAEVVVKRVAEAEVQKVVAPEALAIAQRG